MRHPFFLILVSVLQGMPLDTAATDDPPSLTCDVGGTHYSKTQNQSCCDTESFSANIHDCCSSENIVANIVMCCSKENFEQGNPFGCCTHTPELREASENGNPTANDETDTAPWLTHNIGLCTVFCTDPTHVFQKSFPELCAKANQITGGALSSK